MPELKLVDFGHKVFPIEISTVLSIYVEKGKVKLIFRRENFSEVEEMLVTGEKKIWGKDDLLPFINFVIMDLSRLTIIHYSLE